MVENVKLTLHPERPLPPGVNPAFPEPPPPPAPGPPQIVDLLGRTLNLREIEVLEEQDLIGMVGEPMCLNRVYMARVFAVAAVAAIDGDPLALPLTQAELRVCLKRLRRAGLEAVMTHHNDEREKRERERVALAKK